MRTFGLLITSLLFLSFASFATEDGQAPANKEQGVDKVGGDKGTGTDSLVATGDGQKKKQDNTKKKPSNPASNPNK